MNNLILTVKIHFVHLYVAACESLQGQVATTEEHLTSEPRQPVSVNTCPEGVTHFVDCDGHPASVLWPLIWSNSCFNVFEATKQLLSLQHTHAIDAMDSVAKVNLQSLVNPDLGYEHIIGIADCSVDGTARYVLGSPFWEWGQTPVWSWNFLEGRNFSKSVQP